MNDQQLAQKPSTGTTEPHTTGNYSCVDCVLEKKPSHISYQQAMGSLVKNGVSLCEFHQILRKN